MEEIKMQEIKERFKELRKELKLNQSEFGKRLAVSKDVISNIEIGRVQPKTLLIDAICDTFKVNKDWLVNGSGNMFNDSKENIELEELLYKISKENSSLYPTVLKLSQLDSESLVLIDSLLDKILKK
ncbi:helix-turn-helix domain-containing protein [Clostridium thermobutyricum]|uniref:helix-turn-helix domain-containing protein n=1 Tax=Clostridium thermobutyricum TaxID=29372 RepID=UPI001FAE5E64|nr:helix-turn-helix transcriptional regulator [Clostridium thermobutyricum]